MRNRISALILGVVMLLGNATSIFAENGSTATERNPVMVFSSGCDRAYVNDDYVRIGYNALDRAFLSNGKTYIPLRFSIEKSGGEIKAEGKLVTLKNSKGNTYYITLDRKTLYKTKSEISNADFIIRNDSIYIVAEQMAYLSDTYVFYNESVVYFMNENEEPTENVMTHIEEKLFYERPSEEKIIEDLIKTNPNNEHPRLLCRKDDFDRIRENIKNDEMVRSWYKVQKTTADNALDRAPFCWELRDGLRLLMVAQDVTTRINALALVYQIEGDEKYAERAYLELKAICNYPNWVVTHYLDIGQMCQAAAIGYDWLYEWMTPEQRETIKNGLVRLGLKKLEISYKLFDTGVKISSSVNKAGSWTRVSTNWNPWINSGAIMLGLALGDEEPELAGYIVNRALSSLELALPEYAPDGAGTEGLSYGNAATGNVIRVIACMQSALGDDYGYFNVPGFPGFGYFVPYMSGTTGTFNYGDADRTFAYFTHAFFVAQKLGDPALGIKRIKDIQAKKTSGEFLDIIFYRPEFYKESADAELELSLDKYFRKVETGSMRSRWDDSEAIWLGFHGGDSSIGHAHLDSGSFVLDAMGLNWALDIGKEPLTYTGTGAQIGSDAYLLYRMSPQGHNTLQIGLNKERGQVLESFSPVTEFESKPSGSYAKIDITEAYSHVANSAVRGFALINNRDTVIIQDELELKNKEDIWWLMHTKADIEVSNDGKTAMLSQRGKRLRATLVEPANGTFYAMEAEPLPGTPTNSYQAVNTGIHKLALNVPDTQNTSIRVQFDTIYDDLDLSKEIFEYEPLEDWSVPDKEIKLPQLDAIYIDGKKLEGFRPDVNRYSLPLDIDAKEPPVITVDSQYKTVITQPDNTKYTMGRIVVYDNEDESIVNSYTVSMSVRAFKGLPLKGKKVNVSGVTASAEQVDSTYSNYAKNAVDGNKETRWSAEGKQWICLELERECKVNYVSMAFHAGDTRQNYFDIELSVDGESWTKVYTGETSGTTTDFETHPFTATSAKYVRINCNGHSQSDIGWNSVLEIVVTAEK